MRRAISKCVGGSVSKTIKSQWFKLIKMIFVVHHFRQQQQHWQWDWFLSRHHKPGRGSVRRWGHQFRRHRERRTRTEVQLMKGIEQVYSKVNSLSNLGIHGQSGHRSADKIVIQGQPMFFNGPWIPGRIYSFDEIDFYIIYHNL